MTKIEEFLTQWEDVRNGVVKEVERIPHDKLNFRATPETRSIIELLQHIVESERMLAGEICCDDTDLRRLFTRPPDDEAKGASTKDAVITLLQSSLAATREKVGQFGAEKLEQTMTGLNGKEITKSAMLNFTVGHEMYHRGQLTLYQRLLGIEPALTEQFRKMLGQKQ
jgi:uncharacterized damage-inducible protein DinB